MPSLLRHSRSARQFHATDDIVATVPLCQLMLACARVMFLLQQAAKAIDLHHASPFRRRSSPPLSPMSAHAVLCALNCFCCTVQQNRGRNGGGGHLPFVLCDDLCRLESHNKAGTSKQSIKKGSENLK